MTLLATGNTATAEVVLKVWQTIDGKNPELSQFQDAVSEQLNREKSREVAAEVKGISGSEGTLRVDPPQEAASPASPATGQTKRRTGINLS